MIKLADILKEAISDPLTVVKRRLQNDALSWDKASKKVALTLLGVDKLAKSLFKNSYNKLEYKDRVICIEKALEHITDADTVVKKLEALRLTVSPTNWSERYYIDNRLKDLKQPKTDSQEGSIKEPLAEAKKEEPKIEAFEDFAEVRGKGAAKIATNAEDKGGAALLTWHHFKVKAPYYKKAAEGKFNTEQAEKEYKELLEKLYKATNKRMDITQVGFQQLVGKIEALGELLIKHK